MPGGAGEGLAGEFPMGAELITQPSPVGILVQSQYVPRFDLQTRSFPRDPVTGLLKLIHWVDQAVALALGITNGDFVPQSSLGNGLRKIPRNSPQNLESAVVDVVRVALASLLNRGDIGVTEIIVQTQIRGRILVFLTYVNLRLPLPANIDRNVQFAI